jgi:predicted metal-binding protein
MNPNLYRVRVVIDHFVRGLCARAYPLHPKGCPNVGKSDRCPPNAPLFESVYDMTKPIYAVVNEFPLADHVRRMREKHPNWGDRQLYCVLYWQGAARKQLDKKVKEALAGLPGYTATTCPEGMGVQVTKTMENIGVFLEWPPRNIARHIAILAMLK